MSFTRRSILAGGAAALVSALPVRAERILPATGPRVVVLGGGWGGLTAAKYIRLLDPGIEVVLIERRTAFHSCPISNWVIGHLRTVDEITHSYAALSERHGIQILHTEVEAIDVDAKAIVTSDGVVAGDRLILSPGVAFDYTGIDGWSEAAAKRFPAAWSPGPDTAQLRARLAELPSGGRVALTIPPSPYRCPPGPYERISLMAAYLKQHKPGATITVLDANQKIVSKGKIFQAAWDELYPGIVDYRPDSPLVQVDAATGTVSSDFRRCGCRCRQRHSGAASFTPAPRRRSGAGRSNVGARRPLRLHVHPGLRHPYRGRRHGPDDRGQGAKVRLHRELYGEGGRSGRRGRADRERGLAPVPHQHLLQPRFSGGRGVGRSSVRLRPRDRVTPGPTRLQRCLQPAFRDRSAAGVGLGPRDLARHAGLAGKFRAEGSAGTNPLGAGTSPANPHGPCIWPLRSLPDGDGGCRRIGCCRSFFEFPPPDSPPLPLWQRAPYGGVRHGSMDDPPFRRRPELGPRGLSRSGSTRVE